MRHKRKRIFRKFRKKTKDKMKSWALSVSDVCLSEFYFGSENNDKSSYSSMDDRELRENGLF